MNTTSRIAAVLAATAIAAGSGAGVASAQSSEPDPLTEGNSLPGYAICELLRFASGSANTMVAYDCAAPTVQGSLNLLLNPFGSLSAMSGDGVTHESA